jgi:hypothetical protein
MVRPTRIRLANLFVVLVAFAALSSAPGIAGDAPVPLLDKDHPVDWWFVFKFNTASFPACGANAQRACIFGGDVRDYRGGFSQQFIYASSDHNSLAKGTGCVGDTTTDPLGATFDQLYNKPFYYVVWNDQFYRDPDVGGCGDYCVGPWGHSKGMLAWNEDGDGHVLQVTTPSWPGAGSKRFPRHSDGNTLGCVKDDNVKVSQHFFALKLSHDDVVKVLKALRNASVVTDPANSQVVNNGGPADIRAVVETLGTKTKGTTYTIDTLSSQAQVISKPSNLHVPPWQMVSVALGRVSLRAATWWEENKDTAIPSTTPNTRMGCWADSMPNPGAVEIAKSGQWEGKRIGLTGGDGP